MSMALWDRALREGGALTAAFSDGTEQGLPLDRWRSVDAEDELLADGLRGRVLDVGCGPGRLTALLHGRGLEVLGIDVSDAAVELTRDRDGPAVRCSVFDLLPSGWDHVLLADGNIGIGGDPVRLLQRTRELLAPRGTVLAHVLPPGSGSRQVQARLLDALAPGQWFPWAEVDVDGLGAAAGAAGLVVTGMRAGAASWMAELRAG